MGGKSYKLIEPERYQERVAEAIAARNRFPQGWLRDSDALKPLPFAGVALAVIAVCLWVGVQNGFVLPYVIIIAVCAAIAAVLIGLSLVLYRRHVKEPVRCDLFVADGVLFAPSWVEHRKKNGTSGKGIVRISAISLEDARGYHNKKEGIVWIIPQRQGALRDVWRQGHRWDECRALCEKLIQSGIQGKGDADPFIGVEDVFLDFLVEIGIPIEEATAPVDFLAGTARGVLAGDGD